MTHCYQLSINEREEISLGLAQGLSKNYIALSLGRSSSTICREVNRNTAKGDSIHQKQPPAKVAFSILLSSSFFIMVLSCPFAKTTKQTQIKLIINILNKFFTFTLILKILL
ncbi:unnamed protein product [marine sediment metagenome]|uniref:Transposase IS30-like HTH domain-containing protein n=1 Tax=marine sediment metagenome TaxID=412755 RepID=X1L9S4_9ZZZZ